MRFAITAVVLQNLIVLHRLGNHTACSSIPGQLQKAFRGQFVSLENLPSKPVRAVAAYLTDLLQV